MTKPPPVKRRHQQDSHLPIGGGLEGHHQGHRHHKEGLQKCRTQATGQAQQAKGAAGEVGGLAGGEARAAGEVVAQPVEVSVVLAVEHLAGTRHGTPQQLDQGACRIGQFGHQLAEFIHKGRDHRRGDDSQHHQHQQKTEGKGEGPGTTQFLADPIDHRAQRHGEHHGGEQEDQVLAQVPQQHGCSHQSQQTQPVAKFQGIRPR